MGFRMLSMALPSDGNRYWSLEPGCGPAAPRSADTGVLCTKASKGQPLVTRALCRRQSSHSQRRPPVPSVTCHQTPAPTGSSTELHKVFLKPSRQAVSSPLQWCSLVQTFKTTWLRGSNLPCDVALYWVCISSRIPRADLALEHQLVN